MDSDLLKKICSECLKWFEEKNAVLFERSMVLILLVYEINEWKDTILNSNYFENYINAEMRDNESIKKIWIKGLCYIVSLPAFQMLADSNSKIYKTLWTVINTQISMNPLQTSKLISVSFSINSIKKYILTEDFVAKFLVTTIENFMQFTDLDDCCNLFTMFVRLAKETSGAVVMSKHRDFIEFMSQAIVSANGITPHALQVCINLTMSIDIDSLQA